MNNSPEQFTIGSLSEYQDVVFDIFNRWKAEVNDGKNPFIWFRGQSKDKPLLPSVLREPMNQNTGNVCCYNEFKILVSFSSLYRNYTSERFQEKSSEFYSFMQHYGIPTRLLDWTENAAFALYFAVAHGAHDADAQRVVWLMNPGAINQLTTNSISHAPLLSDGNLVQARMKMVGYIKDEKLTEYFWEDEPNFKELSEKYLQFPLAFYPSSSGNIRIATQKGGFTIHGTDRRPIESFFDNPKIQKYLIKLKIIKESVAPIREQLQIIGVTPRSVYPDIFGFATELSGPDYMLSEGNQSIRNIS